MVKKEFHKTRKDGVNLFRFFSDKKLKIKQSETGIIYGDAIDVENAPYTYDETDQLIEVEEEIENDIPV